jgi:hypothetical protein
MSISDRREIAFNTVAMTAVVTCSQKAMQTIGLGDGIPTGVRFDPEAGKVIVLYAAEQSAPIRPGALGALLISYCLRAGIRVPRHGGRSIRVDRDAVVLVFTVDYPLSPSVLAPERVRSPNLPRGSKEWVRALA